MITGIGVAISGNYDSETHILTQCAINKYEGKPILKLFKQKFNNFIFVGNEANICATAKQFLHANLFSDLIYVHLGEGVGVGVLKKGEILHDNRGYVPEASHIPLGNPYYKCHICGNYGCVESDLSISGFVRKYCGYEVQNYNERKRIWNEFISKVECSDPKALEVIKENGKILGQLISIFANIFYPHTIYIGGVTQPLFASMMPYVDEEVKKRYKNYDPDFSINCDDNSEMSVLVGLAESIYNSWQIL